MATLNFPDSPSTGDTYSDANSGFEYEWNGTVWISKNASTSGKRGNIQEIDDISGSFNGSTTDFTLTSSNTVIEPTNAQQVVISLGGVLQNVNDDYTINGSTITFTTAPVDGLTFFGTYLNTYLSSTTVADNSVSTGSLSASSNYTVGGVNVTGVSTLSGLTFTGISSISNLSSSNLAVTGVGTIANVIHTKDASGLGATMGAAVGVVTYFGDASNMTGIGATLFPYTYSPTNGATDVSLTPTITTTWANFIEAGSGTITIRTGSSSGTIIDQFVVGSSSSITIAGDSLSLTPAVSLAEGTEHFVVYPAGSIKSLGGQHQNLELVTKFTSLENKRYLFVAGYNAIGQIGNNTQNINVSSPLQIGGDDWGKLSSSGGSAQTMMVTKKNGTLWVWGRNDKGELGQNQGGPGNNRSSPTQVGTDTTWGSVDDEDGKMLSGYYVQMAIKTDGTLWGWGQNDDNQYGGAFLGLNDIINRSSPTQCGTDTNWKSIKTIHYSINATKTDGTLWGWGMNSHGSLGQNNVFPAGSVSSPTQIGTATTWDRVISENLAMKTDGSLWGWGANWSGRLGLNDTTFRSSPTQIPGTWTSATAGSGNDGRAVKSDGTLWVWGTNQEGVLGLNNANPAGRVSSPTQVPGTNWKQIVSGSSRTQAMKTDGSLWSWGYGFGGASMLYPGTAAGSRSSPVQVGTDTDWIEMGEGETYVMFRGIKESA
jgi:alpha-tubulin suppressor-like RCC1 family protein